MLTTLSVLGSALFASSKNGPHIINFLAQATRECWPFGNTDQSERKEKLDDFVLLVTQYFTMSNIVASCFSFCAKKVSSTCCAIRFLFEDCHQMVSITDCHTASSDWLSSRCSCTNGKGLHSLCFCTTIVWSGSMSWQQCIAFGGQKASLKIFQLTDVEEHIVISVSH